MQQSAALFTQMLNDQRDKQDRIARDKQGEIKRNASGEIVRDKLMTVISAGQTFALLDYFMDAPLAENRAACLNMTRIGVHVKHDKEMASSLFPKNKSTTPQEALENALTKDTLGIYYTAVGVLHEHARGNATVRQNFADKTGYDATQADEAVKLLATRVESMRGISSLQWFEDRCDIITGTLSGDAGKTAAAKVSLQAAGAAKRIFTIG